MSVSVFGRIKKIKVGARRACATNHKTATMLPQAPNHLHSQRIKNRANICLKQMSARLKGRLAPGVLVDYCLGCIGAMPPGLPLP